MLHWLRRESIALAGEFGAALTVLAQIANAWPMSAWLSALLDGWRTVERWLLETLFALIDQHPHPHITAALLAAAFMAMIGLGARIARHLDANPLPPLTASMRWFEDMTWPSLLIFAGLAMAFLFGQQADPAEGPRLTLLGSHKAGEYAFAVIVAAGYWAGDFIGHRAFHFRLYRMAALVSALLATDGLTRLIAG